MKIKLNSSPQVKNEITKISEQSDNESHATTDPLPHQSDQQEPQQRTTSITLRRTTEGEERGVELI